MYELFSCFLIIAFFTIMILMAYTLSVISNKMSNIIKWLDYISKNIKSLDTNNQSK